MADDETQWVSAMPRNAIEAATHAAEAVKTANHATMHSDDFDHGDLYRLVGELSQLTHRLPQLFEQTATILRRQQAAGDIDVDHGNLPDAMAVWDDAMGAAGVQAGVLAGLVARAHAELSAVKASAVKVAESG